MRLSQCLRLTLFIVSALPLIASAGIIATDGSVYLLAAAPSDAREDKLVDRDRIFVFAEGRHVILSSPLVANIVNPGMYDEQSDVTGKEGELPTGVLLNSYFAHFDIKDGERSALASGSITFDQNVLAIIYGKGMLIDSDAILGLPTTLYGTGGGRGWDLGSGGFIALGDDRRTVDLGSLVTTARDELRIITAVPEAGSLSLMAVGGMFAAAAALTDRHRRNVENLRDRTRVIDA